MLRLIEQFGLEMIRAARQLGRAPGLSGLAVAVLGLGLGAVTAVFGLPDALLFQPLPVARPERLVMLSGPSFSYPQFLEVQRRGTMFDRVFGYERRRLNVRWQQRGGVESAEALLATGDFHATLGVGPALGLVSVARYGEAGPGPAGSAMTVEFELAGQEFLALNGGPHFRFNEAISLLVNCETQDEVDELWTKLTEGGEPSRCGWLKDRYGLSWQIIPTALPELLADPDPARAGRAMQAMLGMQKIEIAELRRAADGVAA